jgi:ABC-type phosphate transport system substrate-binding protein
MRKAMSIAVASLGLLMLTHSVARGAPPTGFKVIVNASNPLVSLTTDELSQLFLKRATQWRAGGSVVPVDLPVAADVRDLFSRKVHGRPAVAIDSFWTKQIFSGAAVPPLTLPSEREVVAYVRQNAGAIAYVSADAGVGEGVKVLDVGSR